MRTIERKYTYHSVADGLRQRIRSGQDAPGQQLLPEPLLAAALQVSRITLRRALDILAAENLVVRQKGRGTFVADWAGAGAGAASGTAAMVAGAALMAVGSMADGVAGGMSGAERRTARSLLYVGDTSSHYWRDLYLAFLDVAQAAGWRMATMQESRLAVAGADLDALRAELDAASCLVATPSAYESLRRLGLLARRHFVVVGGTYDIACPGGAQVRADALRGGYLATRHLLDLGHRRIAFVGPIPQAGPHPELGIPASTNHPYRGYKDALGEAGIAFDPRYALANWSNDSLESQFLKFLDLLPEAITGVVCEADFRAAPVLRALRARGLAVPQAVSVIGIYNTPWCEMLEPRLSSVSLSEDTIARVALALCEAVACAGDVVHVSPRLVRRESTGRVAVPSVASAPIESNSSSGNSTTPVASSAASVSSAAGAVAVTVASQSSPSSA